MTMAPSFEFTKPGETSTGWFSSSRPFVPAFLIDGAGYDQILNTAPKIPARCALGGIIYEIPLEDGPARADISYAMPAGLNYTEVLTNPAEPGVDLSHPVWQAVSKAVRAWEKPGGRLFKKIRFIWLEFDTSCREDEIPSLFFSLSRDCLPDNLLADLQAVLGPDIMRPEFVRYVEEILKGLPEALRILQIGVMCSRATPFLRLCAAIPGIKDRAVLHGAISGMLENGGYAHDIDSILETHARYAACVDRIDIALDIGTGIQPRIGLELFMNQRNPEKDPRWHHLFDQLIDDGLCSPARAEAAKLFYGYTKVYDWKALWPKALYRCWLEHKSSCMSYLVRAISHLKLNHLPGKPLTAKAYLAVSHLWKDFENGTLCSHGAERHFEKLIFLLTACLCGMPAFSSAGNAAFCL